MEENLDKESHTNELDVIYNSTDSKITEENFKDSALIHNVKLYFRFLRRRFSLFFPEKKDNSLKEIIYLTLSKPPLDFISAFRQQYPDKIIKVLIPIDNIEGLEDLEYDVNFFMQNKMHSASLYRIEDPKEHVEIFGLYSEAFAGKNHELLEFLAPFMKATRLVIKELDPDIVHCDNIPFFLGAEFEPSYPPQIKIMQVINDFLAFEEKKIDPFWAAINLADQKNLKKLLKNKIIKKGIASLCALPKSSDNLDEALEFIYENYEQFNQADEDEIVNYKSEINQLNIQVQKNLPQMLIEDDLKYNPLSYTIKTTNCWIVISKTYHKDLLTRPELSGRMYNGLVKTKNKSTYVLYGCKPEPAEILQDFNSENFRDYRDRNKKFVTREFSSARIKINFISSKLFENKNYTIRGFLDSSIEAPLIFCNFSSDIFSTGANIGLAVLLNLLNQHQNVQVIVNIPDGFQNPHVVSWVEYLEQNSSFAGRWMFVDGNVNLPQFYAAADMTLFPAKENPTGCEHYIAMKYGCIPVASRFGIYNDTISDIFEDMTQGCGFKTQNNKNQDIFNDFYSTTQKAINLYNQNEGSWNLLIKNAMNYDSGWNFKIIERYNKIYNLL